MIVLTVSVYVKVYFYPEDGGIRLLCTKCSYFQTYMYHTPEGHHWESFISLRHSVTGCVNLIEKQFVVKLKFHFFLHYILRTWVTECHSTLHYWMPQYPTLLNATVPYITECHSTLHYWMPQHPTLLNATAPYITESQKHKANYSSNTNCLHKVTHIPFYRLTLQCLAQRTVQNYQYFVLRLTL